MPIEPEQRDYARAELLRWQQLAATQGLRPRRAKARNITAESWPSVASDPDDRDPKLVGPTLASMFGDAFWQRHISVASLTSDWAKVVGADIAAHTEPIEFENGSLLLRADSTAWATQLNILRPRILAKIAEEIGNGIVTELVIQGPQRHSFKRGIKSVPGRGPRDTWG